MHEHLLSYLRDNRDQILENWLTEVDIPAAPTAGADCKAGVVPLAFYSEAFDSVLEVIRTGAAPKGTFQSVHLDDFLGVSCACKQRCFGGRVCIELHDAGLQAFMSVFDDDWDADHEFNELDRECCADVINHALSGFIANEIDHCRYKDFRHDCPFVDLASGKSSSDS
ncbi:MAG: hypothetical protein ACPGKS_04230 [Coraliomargarita sp.]